MCVCVCDLPVLVRKLASPLATQRKSLRKFILHALATKYLPVRLARALQRRLWHKYIELVLLHYPSLQGEYLIENGHDPGK